MSENPSGLAEASTNRAFPRVLVVDDESAFRDMVKDMLEGPAEEVLIAPNGPEALRMMAENPCDIVLIDLWLPGMNGVEVIEHLRKRDSKAAFIAMSGHATDTTRERMGQVGIVDFLEKPFTKEQLLTALLRCTQARKDIGQCSFEAGPAGPVLSFLVVDDHAPFRVMLRDMLEAEGHRVQSASSGQEALRKLTDQRFDVVLTDLAMPGLAGAALIRRTRQLAPQVIIWVMTGEVGAHEIAETIKAGAVGCLRKPFDIGQLRALVARAMTPEASSGEDISGTPGQPTRGVARSAQLRRSRKWRIIAALVLAIIAGTLAVVLTDIGHQVSSFVGRLTDEVRAWGGFPRRVEDYLRRDEDREKHRAPPEP